jgi:hypothetical protein
VTAPVSARPRASSGASATTPQRFLAVGCLLLAIALCAASACENASFESLGTRRYVAARPRPALRDAGASDAAIDSSVSTGGSFASPGDAAIVLPVAGSGDPAAGSGGASGMVAASGSGGTATAGAAGEAGGTAPLTGSFAPKTFDGVKAGYVIGRSDEFGTTTVYLLDRSVTCDEISTFAWLAGLPADVQVIEIMFPTTAMTGSATTGSVIVSYAEGGKYSFSKTIASARTLVLSRNDVGGVVEGTLDATFASGSVSGVFHADFCADGMSF